MSKDMKQLQTKPWPEATLPLKFWNGQRVIHLETQGEYLITGLPIDKIIKTESGWMPAYGYRPVKGGPECYRAQAQMEDGRFVLACGEEDYATKFEKWRHFNLSGHYLHT